MDSNPSIEIVDAEATKTSFVWQYFGFLQINGEVDKQSAACKLCKNVTKYSGNTTNLSFHLRRYHGVTPPPAGSGQGHAQRSSQDLHPEGLNPDQEDLFKQNFFVSIPCRIDLSFCSNLSFFQSCHSCQTWIHTSVRSCYFWREE